MCHIVYNSTWEGFANRRTIELKNAELVSLSETDALTQLYNRRKFNEIMLNEWNRAIRTSTSLVLVMFDIDYFKDYNDSYGHLKGDECLATIGGVLREHFKRSNECIARYGGEEFALIIAHAEEDEGIRASDCLIKKIEALRIPHCKSSVCDVVTVSAGVMAMRPRKGQNPEEFIQKVDTALYRAKKSGRNRYVVYRPDET
jgi:diguanylate cyclase (GGDEF)-like protein